MAFESLTDKLSLIFKKLRGKAKITESNIEEMLKEIRIALLEADVNFKVVKSFLENVKQNSISTRNNRFQNICSFLKFVYPNESTRILQFQNIFDIPLKFL